MITQAPRGTKDWMGQDMHRRQVLEKKIRELCKVYNIKEVITPVFEHTMLFQRGVGETTDIVQKEMYTFNDKGDRSITLKPEGTAGAVRAFLENRLYAEAQPTKLYYVTPVFRYEKPQAGRLRQHHQFGVEFLGSKEPLAELEVIMLVKTLWEQLGIKETKLFINSIGCSNCRKTYNEALKKFLKEREDKLCETCRTRMDRNPLRVLDCKVPSCQEELKDAPRTLDYLDDECREHFDELKKLLTALGIEYTVDPNIVRGLDYYTKTVFEFINKDGLTICGGGRYDNLVHEIDGKEDIPAVGFGIGIERLLGNLDNEGIQLEPEPQIDIYIGSLGNDARGRAYQIVTALRNQGIIAETDYLARSVKAQMKYANKINAQRTLILGDDELLNNVGKVKNMANGEQTEIALDQLVAFILSDK